MAEQGQGLTPLVLVNHGSFHPVHSGHIDMMLRAKEALEERGYKVVRAVLATTRVSHLKKKPHLNKRGIFSYEFRQALLQIACEKYDWLWGGDGTSCSSGSRYLKDNEQHLKQLYGKNLIAGTVQGSDVFINYPPKSRPLGSFVRVRVVVQRDEKGDLEQKTSEIRGIMAKCAGSFSDLILLPPRKGITSTCSSTAAMKALESGNKKELVSLCGERVASKLLAASNEELGKRMISSITGDLFVGTSTHNLCHCVSECLGMGKGIAKQFKAKFGGLNDLKSQKHEVGTAPFLKRNGRYIYYLVTKRYYYNKPVLPDLKKSLEAMRNHMISQGQKSISMPEIGCGLDSLKWTDVQKILEEVFAITNITIKVYRLSKKAKKSQAPVVVINSALRKCRCHSCQTSILKGQWRFGVSLREGRYTNWKYHHITCALGLISLENPSKDHGRCNQCGSTFGENIRLWIRISHQGKSCQLCDLCMEYVVLSKREVLASQWLLGVENLKGYNTLRQPARKRGSQIFSFQKED